MVLSGTQPLSMEGDLASHMVEGLDKFLLKKWANLHTHHSYGIASPPEIEEIRIAMNDAFESKDFVEKMDKLQVELLKRQRHHLKQILGVRDQRVPFTSPELISDLKQSPLVAESDLLTVQAIRWPVLLDPTQGSQAVSIYGEGVLLTHKKKAIRGYVVAIPDCEQPPELIAGLTAGLNRDSQFAAFLAEQGLQVIVPTLVSRTLRQSGNTKLTDREYLYRPAFELGRHLIGYEVQQVLAAIDYFEREAKQSDRIKPIGVAGYGEGGMLALYSAAIDPRIQHTLVSGYFDDRRELWHHPIDRNVFGLLPEFGDAELAAMIAPRTLYVSPVAPPRVSIPAGLGGAPAEIEKFDIERVVNETKRISQVVTHVGEVSTELIAPSSLTGFTAELLGQREFQQPDLLRVYRTLDHEARQLRLIAMIDRHNQRLLAESAYTRKEFMKGLDTSSLEKYQHSVEKYRHIFAHEVIGQFSDPLVEPQPRTRRIYDREKWTGYEVVLDVFGGDSAFNQPADVFAYGVLLLPKDIPTGEKRPVVVCQHGLEGRPKDCIEGDHPAYHDFAAKLAERGYIVFAPQNAYIFQDRFRSLQRKANPLGKTLFSLMVPQHQQITNWLKSLPQVDGERIAFYGLSYGGKSAMRIPPLVSNYCLSICSADFNEWVDKNASTRGPYSYANKNEYEIFEYDLGSTFNYAEMAALIAPRPFMVERGHFDGVGTDENVAYEFAKVRNLYAVKLKLPERCQIEWFVGPHTINGQGTFEFLERWLRK